jgi:hypothetical protein
MARIGERLSRIEAATGAGHEVTVWARLGDMRYPRNGRGEAPQESAEYREYLMTAQGQADRSAADRYEASARHVFEGWKTADELKWRVRG